MSNVKFSLLGNKEISSMINSWYRNKNVSWISQPFSVQILFSRNLSIQKDIFITLKLFLRIEVFIQLYNKNYNKGKFSDRVWDIEREVRIRVVKRRPQMIIVSLTNQWIKLFFAENVSHKAVEINFGIDHEKWSFQVWEKKFAGPKCCAIMRRNSTCSDFTSALLHDAFPG